MKTAAALTALSIASRALPLRAADTAPAKKLGVAFVGLGSFATNQLLPGILHAQRCKPVALVSGHPDKANAIADKYSIDRKSIYSYDNYDAIANNPDIDIVYIVLPNGVHAEYTVRAFKAGKHVLCEKPMANTVAECQQMIDAAKQAGKKLQIGYRMHWDAPTLACIAALRRGDIGPLQILNVGTGFTIGDPSQWRLNRKLAGGGCLMDIGIYPLSATMYLTGELPTEVFAHTTQDTSNPKFKEVEQHCDFQLKFPSGVLASCISSYNANFNRFTIYGQRGSAVIEPGQSYSGNKVTISRGRGGTPLEVADVNQFAAEMDGMATALAGETPFLATAEEGLRDMKIIEAIYASAASGKSVKLDLA